MINHRTIQWSDEQLVYNFQQQKTPEIVAMLYLRYFQKVFTYCLRITGNREDALDVTGEVFLKLIEHLEHLRNAAQFQQWLFRIARNEAFDLCQYRQKYRIAPPESFYDFNDTDNSGRESREREENFTKMKAALQALPQDSRDLLQAKYFDGASIETLTERYQSTGSAIKMRLARARKKANENFARA